METSETFLFKQTEEEKSATYFHQDLTTAHTARACMKEITSVFGKRAISRSLWPPLIFIYFYFNLIFILRGTMNDKSV